MGFSRADLTFHSENLGVIAGQQPGLVGRTRGLATSVMDPGVGNGSKWAMSLPSMYRPIIQGVVILYHYSWHFREPMRAVNIPGFIQQINYYAVCFLRAWAENQVSP